MTGRRRSRAASERGVALLSALFAVALLTVIVIEMTDATLVHTHLNRNAGNAMAAQLLARSAATAAEAMVGDDVVNPSGVTCPQNFWALPLFGVPAGAGVVGLRIEDEGGKLDLNSLRARNKDYRTAVENLFDAIGVDRSLVGRVESWIGTTTDGAMESGSGSDYCALSMPCAPRQAPLNTVDELLLIRGFDEQTVARLRPFVTAYPSTPGKNLHAINANTARPEVLEALGCDGVDTLPPCPRSFGGEDGDKKNKEWQAEFDAWKAASCSALPQALQLGGKSNDVYSIVASGTVGDMTQSVRTVVSRKGRGVTLLWWEERPFSEVMPVEVR